MTMKCWRTAKRSCRSIQLQSRKSAFCFVVAFFEPFVLFRSFHDVHLWGRAFNVESMGLYGSVSIKTPINSEQAQEISVLVDAKFAGVQVEVSGCAAEALASILVTVMPNSTDSDNSSSGRSPSMKKVRGCFCSVRLEVQLIIFFLA